MNMTTKYTVNDLFALKEASHKTQMDIMTCLGKMADLERTMAKMNAKLRSLKNKLIDIQGETTDAEKQCASVPSPS